MTEKALSWTLKITHTAPALSGQFCMHSANYKEREKEKKEMEEQFTKRMAEGEKKNKVIILSAKSH